MRNILLYRFCYFVKVRRKADFDGSAFFASPRVGESFLGLSGFAVAGGRDARRSEVSGAGSVGSGSPGRTKRGGAGGASSGGCDGSVRAPSVAQPAARPARAVMSARRMSSGRTPLLCLERRPLARSRGLLRCDSGSAQDGGPRFRHLEADCPMLAAEAAETWFRARASTAPRCRRRATARCGRPSRGRCHSPAPWS